MTDPTYRDEPAPAPQSPPPPATNTAAIAAIVTGIIALALSWIPGINLLAFLLAIVALITGFIGLRKASRAGVGGKGMAVTGLVTGVLALIFGVLVYVGLASFFNDPEVQQELEQMEQEIEGNQPAG